jgi:hypothetical protein
MEFLQFIDLKTLYFIVPVTLFIHEMEEWNIFYFHKNNYSNNLIDETVLSTRLWLLFLSVTGFVWTSVCYIIPNAVVSNTIMMVLVDFTILNSIQHIGMTIKIKKYNPGFIFGGIIGMLGALIVIAKIVIDAQFPDWLLILLLLIVIPGIADSAIQSKKNELPKMVKYILLFSKKLEKLMIE